MNAIRATLVTEDEPEPETCCENPSWYCDKIRGELALYRCRNCKAECAQ